MSLLSRVWCLRAITIREFTLEELLAAKNEKSIAHNHSKGVYLFFIYIQNPKTVNPLCQRSIIQCFKCQDRTLYFHCILIFIFIFLLILNPSELLLLCNFRFCDQERTQSLIACSFFQPIPFRTKRVCFQLNFEVLTFQSLVIS